MEKDHLPLPAGNTCPDAAQDAVGAPCHRGALLTSAWCVHQVFLSQVAFQLVSPMLVCGVTPSQVQGFSFSFVDVNEFAACTFFQPVQVPLYGSTALQSISHLSWFCMGCELAGAALSPSSSSLKKTLSSTDPWGKAPVTGAQLALEHSASAGYQAIPLSTYLGCSSSVCP